MHSQSLARALSQFNTSEPDVWDYREDLQNLSAYLAAGGESEESDALLGAVAGIDTYRGEQTIQTWLHTVISRECRQIAGRESPESVDVHLDRALEAHTHPDSRLPDMNRELLLRRRALDAFAALPEKYRASLLLKDGHGLTVDQTAAMMGTSAAAVRSILYRARSQWRDATA
jgi:RNA polymerase sigma-70 factor (ECF subfamily)